MAVSAICTTLGLGQNAVFVVALLVATLVFQQADLGWQSGVCLGIALGKPQVAGLFLLPLLIRRRYLTVVVAAAVNVLGVAAVVVLTGAGVPTLFRAWFAYMHSMGTWPGYGPLQWSVHLGLPQNLALPLTAGTFSLAAVAATLATRHRPLLPQFALMAVAGRMWSYHQQYDNVMLVFLLAALGHLFVRRPRRRAFAWFALCGVTLWAPAKACDLTPFQVFQVAVWLGAGLHVARAARSFEPSERGEDRPSPDSVSLGIGGE